MLNRNEQFYDNLALYATALQMIDWLLLVSDVSNNDIMEALQQQNKEYMGEDYRPKQPYIAYLVRKGHVY